MLYIDVKYANIISSRLRNNKKKSDYLWNFSCPVCGDSKTNKLKARCYIYRKAAGLFIRCHNCQYSTNIGNFIKLLDSSLYEEYTLETYKESITPSKKVNDVIPEFFKTSIIDSNLDSLHRLDKLPKSHEAVKYVASRKIPEDKYNLIYYTDNFVTYVNNIIPNKLECKEHSRLVLPYLNSHGKCFAVSGRALGKESPKYLNIKYNDDDDLIYGLDRVDYRKQIYVIEGPIDSLFLDNAIAVSGMNFNISTIEKLKSNCVLVYDNQPRLKELIKRMEKNISAGYNICIWPDTIEEKDINDMILSGKTQSDIADIIKENTFRGAVAQLKFAKWRKCE